MKNKRETNRGRGSEREREREREIWEVKLRESGEGVGKGGIK